MEIREERERDREDIYKLIKSAFEDVILSDKTEQDLVERLRFSKDFIKELSLVCVIDEKIVGYILFTKAYVNEEVVLALAPLAVLPEYQRKGVGRALIKEGQKRACKLGYNYSVVLGSNEYYPKFGYEIAKNFGIFPPFPVDDSHFMAISLNGERKIFNGTIKYAEEFNIN